MRAQCFNTFRHVSVRFYFVNFTADVVRFSNAFVYSYFIIYSYSLLSVQLVHQNDVATVDCVAYSWRTAEAAQRRHRRVCHVTGSGYSGMFGETGNQRHRSPLVSVPRATSSSNETKELCDFRACHRADVFANTIRQIYIKCFYFNP